MDTKWEVGLTIGTGVAIALFLAWHSGAKTTAPTSQMTLPAQPPQDRVALDDLSAAANYNPADNVPNGFMIGGNTYNIIAGPGNSIWDFPQGQLVPLNVINQTFGSPANVSNGTPQCGCSNGGGTTLDAIAQQEADAYMKTLAALMAIKPVEPSANININIASAAPSPLAPFVNAAKKVVTDIQEYAGTTDLWSLTS